MGARSVTMYSYLQPHMLTSLETNSLALLTSTIASNGQAKIYQLLTRTRMNALGQTFRNYIPKTEFMVVCMLEIYTSHTGWQVGSDAAPRHISYFVTSK